MVDTISKEEFADWLTPREALAELGGMGSGYTAARAINDHLVRSLIRAAAKIIIQESDDKKTTNNYMMVLPSVWEDATPKYDDEFWTTGSVKVSSDGGYNRELFTEFFGVRFDPAGIAEIKRDAGLEERRPHPRRLAVPPETQEEPEPPATANLGGRPRKEFWEDLLVGMFDQLWHGTLVPKTQADIEGAMEDWLSANGHSASERSIRQRAKSLWKVWTKEGNN